MSEPAAGTEASIPADAIGPLTELAARMAAACSLDARPAEAAAVASTQAKALDLLFHSRIPGGEHVRVYVITVRGRFRALHHGPFGKLPEGTVMTATFDSRTLRGLDTKISDQDDRALLPQWAGIRVCRSDNTDGP